MKFSQAWLQERINPDVSQDELLHRWTMAGLEVDAVTPVAKTFNQVVIGEIKSAERHPDAEKLMLCSVSVGGDADLQIICGDLNVAAGMKVAVATVGAKIGEDFKIKKAKLRGVESYGMLCSAVELGLAESSNGIMVLASEAPIGKDIREYLQLDDKSIDIELTPNRGDCLSIEGIARETGALFSMDVEPLAIQAIPAQIDDVFTVTLDAGEHCPHYVGRVIRDINLNTPSPLWLQEKLRRSGLRSIDPVVDVTNYVMLELGQPMHAFDLDTLNDKIIVRKAQAQESMTLLDGQEVKLDDDVCVIADAKGPLAMAGIMGGEHSGVSDATTNLFLESAFFTPKLISGKARRFGLHTDSSHRFERGVDVALQSIAIERATSLLLEIVGGKPGPLIEATVAEHMPSTNTVTLRKARLQRILGLSIDAEMVTEILQRLGMDVTVHTDSWKVLVPSYRFDITIEEDLVEEVGRVYGYDRIPSHKLETTLDYFDHSEAKLSIRQVRNLLVARDYNEAVTYSFVDPDLQRLLFPKAEGYQLLNPISKELSEMRQSLLPGLLGAVIYNLNRQQQRIRLFESGLRFIHDKHGELEQDVMIAGVATGSLLSKGWSNNTQAADFYDIKADVESLLALTGDVASFSFVPLTGSVYLHPGQAASLLRNGKKIGELGALHPEIAHKMDISCPVYVFECLFKELETAKLPDFATLSKYPAIRRDIAVLVDEEITSADLLSTIRQAAGNLLTDLTIFDVYQGDLAKTGQKSVALGLILQHPDKTLVDEDVNQVQERVVDKLRTEFKATLRD